LFLGIYKFTRKSKNSPNFDVSRRWIINNFKRCKKSKVRSALRNALEKKLEENAYIYLHEIEKLIPNLYHTDCSLLEILNQFKFLDINCIFEGGLTLITVNVFVSSLLLEKKNIFVFEFRPQYNVSSISTTSFLTKFTVFLLRKIR